MDLPTIPYEFDNEMIAQTRGDNTPRVRVYAFDHVAVVIGRGGHQNLELLNENIAADGIPLYKRAGGGCSVVLDPGNVIISLALPLAGISGITGAFKHISNWLISSLAECGIKGVVQNGVSDLVLSEKKIGGSCVHRTRGYLYYSTTLLVEQNMPLVKRYLQHPPREPEYRQGRPHSEFMGTLKAICGISLTDDFLRGIKEQLNNNLQVLSHDVDNLDQQ
ncbi:MAG: lipoate-protein ligase A [Candidatus Krumholzibacteriia bacterium]